MLIIMDIFQIMILAIRLSIDNNSEHSLSYNDNDGDDSLSSNNDSSDDIERD